MAAWNESRITAIDESLARISSGAIETRLPVKADGDEIDHLCLAVNDALDRLAAAMRGMEQVSNDIAHDLRTPLTRLRQRLEASRSGSRTVEQLEQTIDVAIGELDQAHDLFTTMLRIAQIEAGARRSAFATVDLSRLFAEIVETFQVVAEADGRRIEAAIVPKISFVGDREMLTQMIVNIVENALRHTPTGTTVIIQLESASDCAKALIADNGPGIAESDRERVFRRFVRLEAARSTPGTGLGLALVSAIAEVHKINILLDNHHPGLEVHLTFPNRVVAA
jgi:signal transduction histidine kinase